MLRLSPELAVWDFAVERELGRGASSRAWRVRAQDGRELTLKIARDAAHSGRLADEAERLLFVSSRALPELIAAGIVPLHAVEREPRLAGAQGAAFLVLEHARGAALDLDLPKKRRHALALVVARDVGEALADLHAAGSAHGDVKPANVVVDGDRAKLVDLGLGSGADEVSPKGGTRRYLAPETFSSDVVSDARARDLWALGLLIAETASAEVARSPDPATAAANVELPIAIAAVVRALLARAPGVRPSADWVRRRALAALGEDSVPARSEAHITRTYLATRRAEILQAAARSGVRISVGGAPGEWLARAVTIAGQVQRLRGAPISGEAPAIDDLDAGGRARWLVALCGAEAARWPPSSAANDQELAERLLALARDVAPERITYAAIEAKRALASAVPDDPVGVALSLGAGDHRAALLDVAEAMVRDGQASPALAIALGRALRLSGEPGRALAVLGMADDARARVEAARTLRVAGDPDGAMALLAEAERDPRTRAERDALVGRIAFDRGEIERARELALAAEPTAATLELVALAELALGAHRAARDAAERGLALASRDEERARLVAVRGAIFHATGDAHAAREAFRSAADYAVRAGAVLEEATYLTGLAAAAANVGELAEALDAARRSALLFEHLGRQREAARAVLTRASVFAQAGSVVEARESAFDAIYRARLADDKRCRAFAHLALADAAPDDDPEGGEHADRALALLADSEPGDRLHAAARALVRGRAVDVAELDARAHDAEAPLDARLEWWGARARVEAKRERPVRPELLIAELSALAAVRAPLAVLGPALAAGTRLAARVGDGDAARRFALGAREAGRELVRRAPPELRVALSALPWLASVRAPSEGAVSAEQVADLETLVRALGRRDRLRPLLEQVLDALILWTGVERGLLLLRAPGGGLKPRAARNIARSDLTGEQLRLSTSLAERALSERETVVAVDAAGELSDVHASVHALKLRSVLAVPLIANGEVLGVVYLDDRVRRGAFGPAELGWVRLVAALASVAIADARDQLFLRRAARRARRAEAKLADELAQREAALDVAERELARARDARGTRFAYDEFVGQSAPLHALLRLVDRVAVADVPVLVVGESGSGKELVARAIHQHSHRSGRPFVSENCGAIPEGLLESTLFGHVRGAFTGASRPRAGLFEIADGGTLFLDEIAEMSLGMQTRLLRVLQDGELHPVGSERARRVDVRVIGATHRDLASLVRSGGFREDLWYRLDVITLRVPPLRERRGDIPLLVRHFLDRYAPERQVRVSRAALDRLTAFGWPGNVRQLQNEVRRALVLADDVVDLEHLSPEIREAGRTQPEPQSELDLRARVDALESELCEKALELTDGNQTRAAELLGLSRFGLQKMMKRLAIEVARKR